MFETALIASAAWHHAFERIKLGPDKSLRDARVHFPVPVKYVDTEFVLHMTDTLDEDGAVKTGILQLIVEEEMVNWKFRAGPHQEEEHVEIGLWMDGMGPHGFAFVTLFHPFFPGGKSKMNFVAAYLGGEVAFKKMGGSLFAQFPSVNACRVPFKGKLLKFRLKYLLHDHSMMDKLYFLRAGPHNMRSPHGRFNLTYASNIWMQAEPEFHLRHLLENFIWANLELDTSEAEIESLKTMNERVNILQTINKLTSLSAGIVFYCCYYR